MKVESANEVLTPPRLEPSTVNPVVKPEPGKGIDDLFLHFSQEVESSSRTLDKRKIGVRVPPVQAFAQLYEQLGHPAQESFAAVARRVRLQLLTQPSVEKLLESTGGDPARTFVVLKSVLEQADAEVRKSEANLARDAIAKLEIRFKGEIQAGLNIAVALQKAGGDPQERQALRALYYASVVTRQSLATMMQALLGVYGDDRFAHGLGVMSSALTADIAAHASSVPTAMLRTLLVGLRSCGALSGVLCSCRDLTQKLAIDLHAVSLLQRLLGYASTGIASNEVMRLAEDMGDNTPTLVSLNMLYPVFQCLPLALWPDSRSRQEALHNFLLVMDELARLEGRNPRFPDSSILA
ncbi:type III secretion system gatekeeper subunit SctW [Pseudomonas haemolytica]|uniref:Type III secretion system gatekeeper subunit SctW n=1 Tax=Pseudomonas haemolytica TaxID=2600065 RepID=A0A5P1D7A6_9PSED|nr:type III secretion system gatekeeper subunit SctW [Pseudomonas haemolytica]MBJ2244754.1 type III secretion system gatekeeper subunit SctW [Pseudomonas haemolytica]MBJ2271392.1 type III secretion system gatekeeper subunit SctW [Pseudomonas haemolytica]MBK3447456.1 type III secretion system gatekeeper subunit SctW [Pseudomonas haemolytica]MBK3459738.1 type III secretion system gatekeeper subunit SctW [Pseudomonas haemolytica]MRJ35398.1 YopN family type III secretion system gatekeeper subunit 